MAEQVLEALGEHGVTGPTVRLADLDIHPGVEADKGNGDEWPSVRDQILAADILVFSTPTWMGHMSSIAQRALERLDWNGEAMHTVDYKDLDSVPEEVASTTSALAANAAHLARLLQKQGYPAQS
jgi:multimeric flavodoxin WrbA